MSRFPRPRGISRNWKPVELSIEDAVRVIDRTPMARFLLEQAPVEVRAWRVLRGKLRGTLKRVDVAFADGRQASLRFLSRSTSIRIGQEPCR